MNKEQLFNDLGIDPIRAVEFMGYLDLSTDELSIPQRYARFESVLHYLKQFPEDTQRFLIKKATYNKTADKLNCMFEYTNLLKEKSFYNKQADMIAKEKEVIEPTGDVIKMLEITKSEQEVNDKLKFLSDEIEIYHK